MQGKSSVVREIRDTGYTHALTNQGVAGDFWFQSTKATLEVSQTNLRAFKFIKKVAQAQTK